MTSRKYRQLAEQLLANTQDNFYAVIDGAACQPLRQQLYEMQPPYYCLWSGELAPDIQEVAPYLVKVDEHEGFFLWLLENGWENYWNIFIDSPLPLDKLKRKLKTLQFVLSPEKQSLLFRYYDPRVLDLILPFSDKENNNKFFLNINGIQYFSETEQIKVVGNE